MVSDVQGKIGAIDEAIDRKLDQALSHMREDMRSQIREVREQIQSFMHMFARQNQVRLSPDFPSKERSEPMLSGRGLGPRVVETVELEAETVAAGEVFEDQTTNRRPGT